MPDNNILVTTATILHLISNGISDVVESAGGAMAFVVAQGEVGDDTILGFDKNNSLITRRALGGETITFGANGTLNVDGFEGENADALVLVGAGDLSLRYLGHKDGGYAYADASVRLSGFTEGYVTDDVFSGASGARTFFYDNALGLNLGFDRIAQFGKDDLLVTTRRIYDSDGGGTVEFGSNKVLDLSGEGGPLASDSRLHPGGQIDFSGVSGDMTAIDLLGERNVAGVTYFYYGISGTDG